MALLREHLGKRLSAFFTRGNTPLAVHGGTDIDVSHLANRSEWDREVARAFEGAGQAFLTPAELLAPHLGKAIARALAAIGKPGQGLTVWEVGGGSGSLALNALSALREENPALYGGTVWASMDISQRLAEVQRRRVQGEHAGRHEVHVGDCMDVRSWEQLPGDVGVVVAVELLDNLPHDLAERRGRGWQEATVECPSEGERMRPMEDGLVQEALNAFLASRWAVERWWRSRPGSRVFLPTGLMQAMEALRASKREAGFIVLDFFRLPDVQVRGALAPLVASPLPGGRARDFGHYLEPERLDEADILFPTDFRLAAEVVRRASSQPSVERMRLRDFASRFGDVAAATALDGFNPLLHDFSNYGALLSPPAALRQA